MQSHPKLIWYWYIFPVFVSGDDKKRMVMCSNNLKLWYHDDTPQVYAYCPRTDSPFSDCIISSDPVGRWHDQGDQTEWEWDVGRRTEGKEGTLPFQTSWNCWYQQSPMNRHGLNPFFLPMFFVCLLVCLFHFFFLTLILIGLLRFKSFSYKLCFCTCMHTCYVVYIYVCVAFSCMWEPCRIPMHSVRLYYSVLCCNDCNILCFVTWCKLLLSDKLVFHLLCLAQLSWPHRLLCKHAACASNLRGVVIKQLCMTVIDRSTPAIYMYIYCAPGPRIGEYV